MTEKKKNIVERITGFFKESLQELKKVSWPTKDDAVRSATVTVGFIVVFSLLIALIDIVVSQIVLGLVR